MLKRRHLLIAGAGGAAALAALRFGMPAPRAADAHFEVCTPTRNGEPC
jgi:hypothetical protein